MSPAQRARIATWLRWLLALLLLPTIAMLDSRYVKAGQYGSDQQRRDSVRAVQAIRDSVFQADVRRDLQVLKDRIP